jgi:uncharacterized FlaG/YvyC family protein
LNRTEEEWQEHYTKMRTFYEDRLKHLEESINLSMEMNRKLVEIIGNKNKEPTIWRELPEEEILDAYKRVSDKEWAIGGFSDASLFARIIENKVRKNIT